MGKNRLKSQRMTGQAYIGYNRKKIDEKMIVTKSSVQTEERKLGPTCNSKMCEQSKNSFCKDFLEDIRQNIFCNFWKLTWPEKEVFVTCNTSVTKPKKRSGTTPSRRSGTVKYTLNNATDTQKQVCKKMFLNTLGLNEWLALNWINKAHGRKGDEGVDDHEPQTSTSTTNLELSTETKSSKGRQSDKKLHCKNWVEKLSKLPSHYARKDTTKLYLEPIWSSKQEMYRVYKECMVNEGKPWASITTFNLVFDDLNLSLFSPRKDQCDLCCFFKAGNVAREIYDDQVKEKGLARKEKESDKKLAIEGKIHCLTCDLQAVKITPITKASAMYYKTKLTSHNFTVFNLANRECINYWFNETECELNANTFASCLIDF